MLPIYYDYYQSHWRAIASQEANDIKRTERKRDEEGDEPQTRKSTQREAILHIPECQEERHKLNIKLFPNSSISMGSLVI